jgi:hypothetical protein
MTNLPGRIFLMDEVRTFYVERDMDGSEEDTSVLQFILSDKRILALAHAMYSRLTPFYSMSQLTTWMLLTLPGLRTILLASLTTHPSSSPTTRASRTTPSPTSSILTVSSSVVTVVTSRRSDVQARLGPNARARAQLERARAQSINRPSRGLRWQLG